MRKRTDRILFEGAGHLFTEMGKKKVQVHVEKTEWILRVEGDGNLLRKQESGINITLIYSTKFIESFLYPSFSQY